MVFCRWCLHELCCDDIADFHLKHRQISSTYRNIRTAVGNAKIELWYHFYLVSDVAIRIVTVYQTEATRRASPNKI